MTTIPSFELLEAIQSAGNEKGKNIENYHSANNLFINNVRFLIKKNGSNVRDFCNRLASVGINYGISNLDRQSEARNSFLNVLHVVTMARILSVAPGDLISVDLADLHYRDHPDQAPEKWRELHPEFYEGG